MKNTDAPGFRFVYNKRKVEVHEQYSYHHLVLLEWKKNDGDYVNQGELLFLFGYRTSYVNNETIHHFAEQSGFLSIIKKDFGKYVELREDEWLYSLHIDETAWVDERYINEPEIILDEFTGKKIIKWKQVGMIDGYAQGVTSFSQDRQTTLITSFNHIDGKDYLIFLFYKKEILLNAGDSVSFMFENNNPLNYQITVNSHKASHPHIQGLYENRVLVTDEELLVFANSNLVRWKLRLKKQNREIIGGDTGYFRYPAKRELVEVIKKLAKEYRAIVREEITDYQPLLEHELVQAVKSGADSEHCYVYLMHDITNGFYKIGISNQPEWREKTLQSEKPSIELIAAKKLINRKMAAAFEKALHFTYAEKRIRGEWFKLDEGDLSEIIVTLNN